jgi:DNA-directed RNA polymerase subunit RPC12/RpoP
VKKILLTLALIILWPVEKALQAALGAIIGAIIFLPLWAIGIRNFWVYYVIASLVAMSLWGLWEGCGYPMLGLIAWAFVWPFIRLRRWKCPHCGGLTQEFASARDDGSPNWKCCRCGHPVEIKSDLNPTSGH